MTTKMQDSNIRLSSIFGSNSWLKEDEESVESDDVGTNPDVDEFQEQMTYMKALTQEETRKIQASRVVLLVALIASGIVLATGTFFILKNGNQEDNDYEYELAVTAIQAATVYHTSNTFGAFRYLAEAISTEALDMNATFPFVEIKMFEVFGRRARMQSGVEEFSLAPIVTDENRLAWEQFAIDNQRWIEESRSMYPDSQYVGGQLPAFIWQRESDGATIPSPNPGPYAPMWQMSPPPFTTTVVNFNMFSQPWSARLYGVVREVREGVVSEVLDFSALSGNALGPEEDMKLHGDAVDGLETPGEMYRHPHSALVQPIFQHNQHGDVVALLQAILPWDVFISDSLSEGVDGIHCVLKNTCNQSFTYLLNGSKPIYLGSGDHHDSQYEDKEVFIPLSDYQSPEFTSSVQGHCEYSLHLYPSQAFYETNKSHSATTLTSVTAFVFVFLAVLFVLYDHFVRLRSNRMIDSAETTHALVSSLFPSNVRERLFNRGTTKGAGPISLSEDFAEVLPITHSDENDDRPIADLFPSTTILFADMVGFTAWSSARQPCQVFELLETLYEAFDKIAKRRKVYKVETIGDCYVAVCGLPEPCEDHAVVMASFARDIMLKMQTLTKKLEVSLGPDTAELVMRAGLHSGPVTAGVLRGERSRFQLFGDTMNTASRMESNGKPGGIQISADTARLLEDAGKENWISPREDKIHAKGKGEMQTYWLKMKPARRNERESFHESGGSKNSVFSESEYSSCTSEGDDDSTCDQPLVSGHFSRLVDWNVDVLQNLLKEIRMSHTPNLFIEGAKRSHFVSNFNGSSIFDDFTEVICFIQNVDTSGEPNWVKKQTLELEPAVEAQLYEYVSRLALMHKDNPYHSFERASYVAMSVTKLINGAAAAAKLHDGSDYTDDVKKSLFRIICDPAVQFACVFSALIHSLGHDGLSTAQLVSERSPLVATYGQKCIPEQKSIDDAFNLLGSEDFDDLRDAMFASEKDATFFRQLVVNFVISMSQEDEALKCRRWNNAFAESSPHRAGLEDLVNTKATIFLEQILQSSTVIHTMQHWQLYEKWSTRLFRESYAVYAEGRTSLNPAIRWYERELAFFDTYVIPLASMMKESRLIGGSGAELLNYALKNRHAWEMDGRSIVDDMVQGFIDEKFAMREKSSKRTQLARTRQDSSVKFY